MQIAISQRDANYESHSFIIYKKDNKALFIDPIMGLFGTQSDFIQQLIQNNKPTFYHTNYEPMNIELHFR